MTRSAPPQPEPPVRRSRGSHSTSTQPRLRAAPPRQGQACNVRVPKSGWPRGRDHSITPAVSFSASYRQVGTITSWPCRSATAAHTVSAAAARPAPFVTAAGAPPRPEAVGVLGGGVHGAARRRSSSVQWAAGAVAAIAGEILPPPFSFSEVAKHGHLKSRRSGQPRQRSPQHQMPPGFSFA